MRYGLLKRLHRGVRISLSITYRCNLKCPYCSLTMPAGKMPRAKESSLKEIQGAVEKFPYKIREVFVSGGAPELHPDFVELVNWLLDKKYFVHLFTNLMFPEVLLNIKKTKRFLITASYHHTDTWAA